MRCLISHRDQHLDAVGYHGLLLTEIRQTEPFMSESPGWIGRRTGSAILDLVRPRRLGMANRRSCTQLFEPQTNG